ncbi:terminase small subunit, Nu1 [Roseovarius pacificus]|uniref:terminase small subunit, Nu1 n=1 Tax=Roseovarius pacificus TaxID=337701 RepID=UPI002A18CA49|nr:terminase small subunit, Nu1 [Roseovarius pacificus]
MSGAGSPTYPAKTIAKLLMLTERRVQQLSKEGVIPKAERGRYELATAVQGYIRYLQDRMAGNASQVDSVDYHKEKARKIKAEADIAEIEASKRRGEAIDAQEVKRAWQLILGEVRANMIGATPARIAQLILGIDDETEIKRIVRDEIELAMKAASESDVDDLFDEAGVASDGVQ